MQQIKQRKHRSETKKLYWITAQYGIIKA